MEEARYINKELETKDINDKNAAKMAVYEEKMAEYVDRIMRMADTLMFLINKEKDLD